MGSHLKQKKRGGKSRNQRPMKPRLLAAQKGVMPIRREVDSESYEVFRNINTRLKPHMTGKVELYPKRDLKVTVLPMLRINLDMLGQIPTTQEVLRRVGSCVRSIPVELGALTLKGATRDNLSFDVDSPQLEEEIAKIEEIYREYEPLPGTILQAHPHGESDVYIPHCTVGKLRTEQESTMDPSPDILELFNEAIKNSEKVIVLRALDPRRFAPAY